MAVKTSQDLNNKDELKWIPHYLLNHAPEWLKTGKVGEFQFSKISPKVLMMSLPVETLQVCATGDFKHLRNKKVFEFESGLKLFHKKLEQPVELEKIMALTNTDVGPVLTYALLFARCALLSHNIYRSMYASKHKKVSSLIRFKPRDQAKWKILVEWATTHKFNMSK